jgi:hypothetical protein
VPKATNLCNNAWEKGHVRTQRNTKRASQQKLLTSLEEIVDAWASRETLVSLSFFKHLRFRVTGIFLTEALVTLAVASCSTGSSAIAGEVEGAAGASFGGSLSSLQKEKEIMYSTKETKQERCN